MRKKPKALGLTLLVLFLIFLGAMCPALVAPVNGNYTLSDGLYYNSVATYICDEGYRVKGAAERTCQYTQGNNGFEYKWTSNAPMCTCRFCQF